MKLLFVLLFSFITILSTENEVENRIKCCGGDILEIDSYLEDGYKYHKNYNLNMSFVRNEETNRYDIRRDKVEYTTVGEEGVSLKFITQIKRGKLDNLSFKVFNNRRKVIKMETRELSEKIRETKFTFPQTGIYYLAFARKDTTDIDEICGGAAAFIKK
ncbi:hypothetical protein [Bernardetia sp.]|uniref:hypothetical protein n=1 Tax=Bernardetia sp. TaxID=1937974 RepID=UPI0025C23097|nr:hypothetical protein [Bernardetia sp.]